MLEILGQGVVNLKYASQNCHVLKGNYVPKGFLGQIRSTRATKQTEKYKQQNDPDIAYRHVTHPCDRQTPGGHMHLNSVAANYRNGTL